jgi:uncharacterized protein
VELDVHTALLAVCRLSPGGDLPAWVDLESEPLVSITRSSDELSIVLPQSFVPSDVPTEKGWRALSVRGPLPFAMTGVLASLAAPLGDAGVPIFVISTYDTDWLLVSDARLSEATAALEDAGHRVHGAA